MPNPPELTRVDRIMRYFRDHPVFAVLIVGAAGVVFIGQLTGAVGQIRRFFMEPDPSSARATSKADSVARTYTRLKYDLQKLDNQLRWMSETDTAVVRAEMPTAVELAGVVCDYRTAMVDLDDAVGVRTADRACSHAQYIHGLDSALRNHPSAYDDTALFFVKMASTGFRIILQKESSSLMGAPTR